VNWKHCLTSGSQALEAGELWESEQFYVQALDELERLTGTGAPGDELLSGWVAAHHGCSALYEHRGEDQMAFRHLMWPHQQMLSRYEQTEDEAIRIQLKGMMQQTLPPLLAHARTKPLCEGCRRVLTESEALLGGIPVAH